MWELSEKKKEKKRNRACMEQQRFIALILYFRFLRIICMRADVKF